VAAVYHLLECGIYAAPDYRRMLDGTRELDLGGRGRRVCSRIKKESVHGKSTWDARDCPKKGPSTAQITPPDEKHAPVFRGADDEFIQALGKWGGGSRWPVSHCAKGVFCAGCDPLKSARARSAGDVKPGRPDGPVDRGFFFERNLPA